MFSKGSHTHLPRPEQTPSPAALDTVNTTESTSGIKLSPATSRNPGRTENERRRLGWDRYHIDDIDAVPISTPTSRVKQESMPNIYNGGPQPTNTLGSHPNQSQKTYGGSIKSVGSGLRNGVHKLFTRAVYGDNVDSASDKDSNFSWFEDVPLPKRIKTTHPLKSQSVPNHDEIESYGSDELGSESSPQRSRSPPIDPALSIGSRASSSALRTSGLLRMPSNESRKLEDMMNSDNYARNNQTQRKRGRPKKNMSVLLSSQPHHSGSAPIDLTRVEQPAKPKYQGTARPSTKTRGLHVSENLNGGSASDYKSRYFENHSRLTAPAARPNRELAIADDKLQTQFISEDGKRRNLGVGSSPDELAADIEFTSISRIVPQKQARQKSPSPKTIKPRRRSVSPDDGISVDPSSMKPTQFTDHTTISSVTIPHTKRRKVTYKQEPEGYEAVAVVVGHTHLSGETNGLGLVFDDAANALEVYYDGVNLSTENASFRLQLPKLLKVVWAPDSSVVSLEFSRTGNQPCNMHAKLVSESKVIQFTKSLQRRSAKVDVQDRKKSYMEKMFANRLLELPNQKPSSTGTVNQQDPDLQLILKRKQCREGISSGLEDHGQANIKRQRAGPSVIDKLVGNTSQNDRAQTFDTSTSSSKPQTRIDEIMTKVFKKNGNPYLTRSTSTSRDTAAHAKQASVLTEMYQEEHRYSQEVGLGPKWKRPLIYPQLGKKKATVDFADLERLDEGQFLNDNLIGFYMRYLECQLEEQRPQMAKKVYWFNTYFFASLTQSAKGRRGINYDAVRKWTRNVDVFTYDYAVVPINESAHWYVAIICNLRALHRKLDIIGGDGPGSPEPRSFGGVTEAHLRADRNKTLVGKDLVHGKFNGDAIELDKTEDDDTRESFADLQLNEREALESPHDISNTHSEDELLDQGKADAVTESETIPLTLLHGDTQDVEGDEGSIIMGEAPALPTPATQKRGKRKSMPSPRVFDADQPAIITLDSLGMAHSPTVRVLKDYLHEEANDKRGGMELDESEIKGITAKGIPSQNNYCDCGLFLLGYMDKFVENPTQFVTKILKREFDQQRDWPNLIPSSMRADIRSLILGLHRHQEGPKVEGRKQIVGKVAKHEQKEQQVAPSDIAITDTLSTSKTTADEDVGRAEDKSKAVVGVPLDQPTRRDALNSALGIDEQVAHKKSAIGHVGNVILEHNRSALSSHVSVAAPKEPFVISDSQEAITNTGTLGNLVTNESAELVQQLAELPLEIPDTPPPGTPPRLYTRGKPRPDSGMEHATKASASDPHSNLRVKSPRENRKVISISDN